MDAIPTPYDIRPLPYFPYSPGVWEWIVFGSVLLGLVALVHLWVTLRSRNPKQNAPAKLLALTLKRLLDTEDARNAAWSASLAIRRFLATTFRQPFDAMTAKELIASSTSPEISKMIEIAVNLEQAKYSGTPDLTSVRATLTAGAELAVSLASSLTNDSTHGTAAKKDRSLK